MANRKRPRGVYHTSPYLSIVQAGPGRGLVERRRHVIESEYGRTPTFVTCVAMHVPRILPG